MELTANVDLDDFAQEIVQVIMDSVDFDSHVNGLIDNLLTEQIEEHIGNIDIDDIGDFERRAEEIARDVVSESLDDEVNDKVRDAVEQAMADVADPQDSDDRITNLEQTVEILKAQVSALTDALDSAAALLALAAKVVSDGTGN